MTKTTDPRSPFLWQGKESIFCSDKAHNGVHHRNSILATQRKDPPVMLRSDSVYLELSPKSAVQCFVYSRAKSCRGA